MAPKPPNGCAIPGPPFLPDPWGPTLRCDKHVWKRGTEGIEEGMASSLHPGLRNVGPTSRVSQVQSGGTCSGVQSARPHWPEGPAQLPLLSTSQKRDLHFVFKSAPCRHAEEGLSQNSSTPAELVLQKHLLLFHFSPR